MTTLKQIVEDVIDEMERKTTISYPKQYRKIIVFKLTTKIGAFVRERNFKAAQEILDSVKETPCAKCGIPKN